MNDLVTLKQARDQLRMEAGGDDEDLQLKITAASEMVLRYLGKGADAFLQEDGTVATDAQGKPQGIPATVQLATLVTVNYLVRERDGSQKNAVDPQHGYGYALPKSAVSMLYSMRRPGIA